MQIELCAIIDGIPSGGLDCDIIVNIMLQNGTIASKHKVLWSWLQTSPCEPVAFCVLYVMKT